MTEETLFAAALDKTVASERKAFLDEACAGQATLRQRVGRLLAADEEAVGILDRMPGPSTFAESDEFAPGEVEVGRGDHGVTLLAGRYELIRKVGEGGMGTVWLAEQTEPVRRRVALKLVKAGLFSKSTLTRFEAERQALALMDHPNIAKVLDADTTAAGRPFFVMEFVEGVPITEYCDNARLGVRARLELIILVCQAVQHAHTKGVIHRDLKPTNILVTSYDGVPVPKVIDFGVAKATGPKPAEWSTLTQHGQLLGTPLYMSPEQAGMGNLDIDTRSDVYSLGALLYELLTGSTPFEWKEPGDSTLHDLLRSIREREPQRPSARLTSAEGLPRIAECRGTEPGRLARLVRGDLDWIVMKALEKDRDRRYETAKGLAMDLERYLADAPVLARPPGTGYQLRKFVRRNKGPIVAAAALAVSLFVGGGAVVTVKARADRERATRDAQTTASVAVSLRETLERVDEAWRVADDPARMHEVTAVARTALRRAEVFADGGSTTAATLAELAGARRAVDDLARHTRLVVTRDENRQRFAEEVTGLTPIRARIGYCERQSGAIRELGLDPVGGEPDRVVPAVVDSPLRDALLGMLLEWHTHASAVADAREKDPGQIPDSPVANRAVADHLGGLVRSIRRSCKGGYARWQDLLDRRDVPGLVAFAESRDALQFRSGLVAALGRDLNRVGEYTAMQTLLRAAIERYPNDPWLHFDLSWSSRNRRPADYTEALHHMSAATALRPKSALFHQYLSECYAILGSLDRAIAAQRQAVGLSPGWAAGHRTLGRLLMLKKDWDGAIAAYREAIRLRPDEMAAYSGLGTTLARAGRHPEAFRVALDALQKLPARAKDPRTLLRYTAAYLALNCADGKGGQVPPPAEGAAYRKEALDLLTADIAAIRGLPKTDAGWVRQRMQHWLTDADLASVREPGAVERLPGDEREAWRRLWTEVRSLQGGAAP